MVRTLQITQSGSAIQLSATPQKVKWLAFFNTAAAAMRAGDSNVTASRGIPLPASTGSFVVPVAIASTFGTDLSQWYTIGTATQVLDVVYDDMNF